jgi:hypothetical protein
LVDFLNKRVFWFALPSSIVVLMLWLPFGLNLHGLIEEWGVLGVFSNSGAVLFVKSHTFLEAHRLRPLTVFPHAIGYLLDRDSFDAWNWILMATLVLKGAASSYLAAVATRSPRWGMFFGLLVLLYPADTMQLSFRSQHINLSLAVLLLSAAWLVCAQYQEAGWGRRINVALGCVGMLAAQMMYEVALMMLVLPLLVVWCREGTRGALRKLWRNPWPTLGWITPALLYVLYVAWASATGGDSYQQTITDRHSPFKLLYSALPKLFDVGIVRALVGGWFDAWGMATREFQSYWYLLAFGLLCAACLLFFSSGEVRAGPAEAPSNKLRNVRLQLRIALAGLLLLILGYIPYLFSGSHVLISQRTFLFSTFGAALTVTAVAMILARVSRTSAGVAVVLLLTVGAAAQLYQFHHYVTLSEAQRKVLRVIVENFDPSVAHGKSLLIIDHSDRLSHIWMLRDNLDSALTYLYDQPVAMPEICLGADRDWQKPDALWRTGHCIEDSQAWTFKAAGAIPNMPGPPAPDVSRQKSQMVQVVIDQDGNVAPDKALDAYRAQLETADTSAARRYRNILRSTPAFAAPSMFKRAEGGASYRWDFGSWWSMEKPIHGTGWREAEWSPGYFHHDAAAWKSQEKSSLLFDLNPSDRPYEISGTFDIVYSALIQDSMRLLVNGIEVPIVWMPGYAFRASVPTGALRRGANRLEFNSAIDEAYYGLSARLSEVEVRDEPAALPSK